MSKKKNELHIAFSLGSIIDIKKAEEIYETKGMKAFKEVLKKHHEKNSIFDVGPSLGWFFALRRINNMIPDEILSIKFALVSKIDPNPEIKNVIMDSMYYYLNENKDPNKNILNHGFDMIAFTGGEDIDIFLGDDVFDTDLYFSSSEENTKMLNSKNINTIFIENKSKENNIELYNKRNENIIIFSDFDGVLGDGLSEEVYQKALKEGKDAILAFAEYEEKNKNKPMKLGPFGKTIQKLSRVTRYQINDGLNKNDLCVNIVIVTARGGHSYNRCNLTLEKYNIYTSQLYMLQGQNKNYILQKLGKKNKGKNLLFVDDSEIHFKRSQELANFTSAWLPN